MHLSALDYTSCKLQTMQTRSRIAYLTAWIFIIVISLSFAAPNQDHGGEGSDERNSGSQGDSAEHKHACEGTNLTLACGEGKKLHIKSADYRYAPKGLCGAEEIPPVKSCSTVIQQHVERFCNNNPRCTVPFNKNISQGTACDLPIPTYLIVQWTCKSQHSPIIDRSTGGWTTPRYADGKTCPMVERRDIVWPETYGGSVARGTCPNNDGAEGTWRCASSNPPQWVGEPNLQNCRSRFIIQLEIQLESEIISEKSETFNPTSYRTVINKMVTYTDELQVYGGDLPGISSIMKKLVSQINHTVQTDKGDAAKEVVRDVTGAILKTSSNLLRDDIWNDLPKESWSSEVTQILSAVETSAFQLADTDQSSINVTENIVLQVQVVDTARQGDDLTFPPHPHLRDTSWQATSTSVRLTKEAVQDLTQSGRASVVFAMYRNVAALMPPKPQNKTSAEEAQDDCSLYSNCSSMERFVNSEILSASVGSAHTSNRVSLKHDVVFTLQHNRTDNVVNATCAFWDYSEELQVGDWSSDGCRVLDSNSTHTTCSCDHLTSFAIIMTPTQPQISGANEFALAVITYFGCIISIICLLLAFITFVSFKNLQCDRNTVHKNLCLTLLIANIVFLAGIMQYQIPVLCSIVAAVLHYFFLAAFAWMCLEGIQLYIMLVEVFEAEKSRVWWYYIGAYGCPAVIVASSAAIYHQGYGTDHHCWLTTERGFVWGFIGPAICIIVVNSFMLGVAIRAMIQHAKSAAALRMKEKTKLEQIRLWLKGTIILVFLLGLTWLFGLMYVSASTLAFAYIFTILNSLQGLFIFIFHCIMNDKVRTEYRKFIRRSTCLPESFRNKYGEKSKSAAYSSTPNCDSSGKGSGAKILGNVKRKSSETTTLSKSSSNAREGNDNHHIRREEAPAVVHAPAAVDSRIDDPSSYSETPPVINHHRDSESEINDNIDDNDVTGDVTASPREPSTADYLETIKDRRRIAESLSARQSQLSGSRPVSGSYPLGSNPASRSSGVPLDRHTSSEDEDEEKSLMRKPVGRLSSVTAV